jgi:hypothetical protein
MKQLFISESDLSKRWAIPKRTLQNKRYNGTGIPFVKIGGAVRYRLSDVEAAEKANTLTCSAAYNRKEPLLTAARYSLATRRTQ